MQGPLGGQSQWGRKMGERKEKGRYMLTIVPSDAPRIVNPRHCCPFGPAQWSSPPVGAGGGAVVEVGGGASGGVSVHTWY